MTVIFSHSNQQSCNAKCGTCSLPKDIGPCVEFSLDGFTMHDPNSVKDLAMGGVKEMPTDSSKIFAAHL